MLIKRKAQKLRQEDRERIIGAVFGSAMNRDRGIARDCKVVPGIASE